MIVAGCDVGSMTGKAVILNGGGIVSSCIVPGSIRPEATAKEALNGALAKADLKTEDIGYLVATGYGRSKISSADENVSEITCHGKGASWQLPSIKTIIDIGGQDCKAISLDAEGNVNDFLMNDKCAAGTGRFLEVMARALKLELEELGPVSLKSNDAAVISNQCGIFAESEIIGLLVEGASIAYVAAGIHKSVASRLVSMVRRLGLKNDLTLTGGVAKNSGLVKMLEDELGEIHRLPEDPQLTGALGAAVLAKERLRKRHG